MNGKRIKGWWDRSGRVVLTGLLAALLALVLAACEKQSGQQAGEVIEIVFGIQCDRSGPVKTIAIFWCDGKHDYIKLFNAKQSLGPKYRIRAMEIDHGYNVPRGMEAYERMKEAGAVTISIAGTPHTYALTPKLLADKIPGTSPGFGNAASADGKRFPYLFPIAASYWSQAASAVKFVMDLWSGGSPPKIAYLYYDNPAGREPLPIMRDLQKRLGYALREFAVPPPGIEMRPQVLDIVRNYKADWIISHLFGRAPAVSIKEFARMGFPRDRIVSLVWGSAESDLDVAGWDVADGYYGLQFTGIGDDFEVIREIKQLYRDEGKDPPPSMRISVYYNRGVFVGAIHARAIQLALEKHGYPIKGEHVAKAFESIQDFDLGGFLPPLNITPEDHEGGGWVKIYQAKNGGWQPATDWMRGYRDVVLEHVAQAE